MELGAEYRRAFSLVSWKRLRTWSVLTVWVKWAKRMRARWIIYSNLPNSSNDQTLPYTLHRGPLACGWYFNKGLLRLCTRRCGSSAGFTVAAADQIFVVWSRVWKREWDPLYARQTVLHWGAIPLLFAWFIPHAEWNMNEAPYPDWAKFRLCASFAVSHYSGLLGCSCFLSEKEFCTNDSRPSRVCESKEGSFI